MKLEDLIRTGLSRIDPIAVRRTALNPALWLVGLVSPLSLILAAFVTDPSARTVLFCFAGAPLLFAMIGYLILLFREPDRLQSKSTEYNSEPSIFFIGRVAALRL